MLKLPQRIKALQRGDALDNKEAEGTEISFADVVRFLRYNAKFFGLAFLGFSIVGVTLALLMPGQYEKRVDLSVRQVPLALSPNRSDIKIEDISRERLGNQAITFIQGRDLGDVSVAPRYDRPLQKVELVLSSRDPGTLDGASTTAVNLLNTEFQTFFADLLSPAVGARLAELGSAIKYQNRTLGYIDQQIEKTSAGSAEDVGAVARIEGLEGQRARVLSEIIITEI